MKYSFTAENVQYICNLAKEMLLERMAKSGELKKSSEEMKIKYAFVVLQKNTLGKTLDDLLFSSSKIPRIQLIDTEFMVEQEQQEQSKLTTLKKPGLRVVKDEKKEKE